MIINLGLGIGQRVRGDSAPQIAVTQITLTVFSRDRTLFDSGAAFGRNEALVPFSGTGTQARLFKWALLHRSAAARNAP